jgi:hypothetical protein
MLEWWSFIEVVVADIKMQRVLPAESEDRGGAENQGRPTLQYRVGWA